MTLKIDCLSWNFKNSQTATFSSANNGGGGNYDSEVSVWVGIKPFSEEWRFFWRFGIYGRFREDMSVS
jgi:hypothetical protein